MEGTSEAWALLDVSTDPATLLWEVEGVIRVEVVGDQIHYWRGCVDYRFDIESQVEQVADSALWSCAVAESGRCCHVDDFTYATFVDGVETVVVLSEDVFVPQLIDCAVHPSGEVSVVRSDGQDWTLERRDALGKVIRASSGPSPAFGPDYDWVPMTQDGRRHGCRAWWMTSPRPG